MVLDAVTGWVLFTGLLPVLGTVAGRWVILPLAFGADDPARARLQRSAAGVGMAASIVTASGLGLYLFRQIQEFRDPFAPLSEDVSLLMSTAWGASWTAAIIVTILLLGATALARSGRALGWWLATPLALALAAFPGLTGHASGADARFLALLFDSMHVWAAGAWIGGLALVVYLEAREDRASSLLPALVPAFSPVAITSVALLVLTGLYASWSQLETIGALASTAYGRLLSLKLLSVAVVLAFGARNFRILSPQLGTDQGTHAMRRSIALELAAVQVVLLITAVLIRTSPDGH